MIDKDALTYWVLLQEAYQAEEAYQAISARDRRRITNKIAFRRNAAHKALANFMREHQA